MKAGIRERIPGSTEQPVHEIPTARLRRLRQVQDAGIYTKLVLQPWHCLIKFSDLLPAIPTLAAQLARRVSPAEEVFARICTVLICFLILEQTAMGRQWRSADGKSTIQGELVRCDGHQVTIRFSDGTSGSYDLNFFSQIDRVFATCAGEVIERSQARQEKYILVLKKQGAEALCQWGSFDRRAGVVRFDGGFFIFITTLDVRKGSKLENEKKLFWCGVVPGVEPTISYYAESIELAAAHLGKLRGPSSTPPSTPPPSIPPRGGSITSMAFGTCFAITEDGFCITNEHVIRGAAEIQVRVHTRELPARVVYQDGKLDLAVMKTEWQTKPLTLRFGDNVTLGTKVFTIGFPKPSVQGVMPKFTEGVVSSLAGLKDNPLHYQHSVPIQPGNSGGALVDQFGQVVGIIDSFLAGDDVQNVNYAVKASDAMKWLQSLPDLADKLRSVHPTEWDYETAKQMAEAATGMVVVSLTGSPPQSAPPNGTAQFSLSKGGVRHNARCRYFDSALGCSSTDGRPCKLCGG